MKYIGPIIYKNKLTVDGRAFDPNSTFILKENAVVTAALFINEARTVVGKVNWIWDHGDEVWAALDIDGTPPEEDDLYPQVEVKHGVPNWRGTKPKMTTWFIGEVEILSVHLGKDPVWPDLPPVKPS